MANETINVTIHVYNYENRESFQFTTLKDFLRWSNDEFDCIKHVATTDYEKIKALINMS